MTNIFRDTLTKAIFKYRRILRKTLPQVERINTLTRLGLRDSALYQNDIALYHAAHAIIDEIHNKRSAPEKSGTYYSYMGLQYFCDYLEDYLKQYSLEGNKIVHETQRASRLIVNAIQLLAQLSQTTSQNLTSLQNRIMQANTDIVKFGESEHYQLYEQTLRRAAQESHAAKKILEDFSHKLADRLDWGLGTAEEG